VSRSRRSSSRSSTAELATRTRDRDGRGRRVGAGQFGAFCRLFGTTVPLPPEQLAALYADHRAFVRRWSQATDRAVAAGFIHEADAKELTDAAASSEVGEQS
jgi:Alpha/beta hydrolase domain